MKSTATSTPDPKPKPLALACAGCRYGTRVVDVERKEPEEDGDQWKAPVTREVEGYYCVHPVVHDPAESSVIVTARIFCGFREEGPCTAKP